VGLALWAAATLALACGPAAAERRTHLQVVLWETGASQERDCVTDLVEAFQRRYPGVLIALEWRDAAEAESTVARWLNGHRRYAPDVTVLTDVWVKEHRRDLLPLNGELRRDVRERFVASVLEQGGELKPLRGVPWTVATTALYYRSDLLAEAELEPPRDFEGLVKCAAALGDPPERYGFGLPGVGAGAEDLLYALAAAAGGEMAEEGEEVMATAGPFERALGLLVELQSRGALQPEVLTWTEAELGELMATGRLGMMAARPWLAAMLRRAPEEIKHGAVPLPREPEGKTHVTVDWMVAFRDTDRQEQALELLQFVAEEGSQRALAVVGGVPATKGLCEELKGRPPWAAHVAGLVEARGLPLKQWLRLKAELGHALTYAISGRRSPAAALQEAASIEA
jgi:ABC-type glycerol-3-phosphate transport system substrate-binding protein